MQDLFAGSSIGRGTSDGTGSQAETVDSLASTNIFYHAKHVPCGAECKFCHHKVTLAILTLAKPFLFLAKSFDPDVENIIFFVLSTSFFLSQHRFFRIPNTGRREKRIGWLGYGDNVSGRLAVEAAEWC